MAFSHSESASLPSDPRTGVDTRPMQVRRLESAAPCGDLPHLLSTTPFMMIHHFDVDALFAVNTIPVLCSLSYPLNW